MQWLDLTKGRTTECSRLKGASWWQRRRCYWNGVSISAFVFPYCCFGIPRITISIVWLSFQALACLIGLLTGAVVDSEKCSRGPVVLATQRARCHSGAKLLSLPNLSGWSAKANGVLGGSIVPGRDYCSFPKTFQPSTLSVSPLCNYR